VDGKTGGFVSGERPAARTQGLKNAIGEYHKPPSTKLDAAATSTAQMLMFSMISS
jgi:hypothetical protein